ncbi:MAG: hypothetical protein OEV08_11110 [Nitrospira sp.]|nr:hypothetical protein [Nitrospira sp.]
MSDQQLIQSNGPDIVKMLSGVVMRAMQWVLGAVLILLVGSWLAWWAMYLQRQFAEDEIRAACQRVMPDTVQRCVDTVIIQRGGARR